MNKIIAKAIETIKESSKTYFKFLSSNDTSCGGGHQRGVLISKEGKNLLFDGELPKNGIIKRKVDIYWPDLYLKTESNFTYYSSKRELRITNFGKGFPFFKPFQKGSLFILSEMGNSQYHSFIIDNENDAKELLSILEIKETQIPFTLLPSSKSFFQVLDEFLDFRNDNNLPLLNGSFMISFAEDFVESIFLSSYNLESLPGLSVAELFSLSLTVEERCLKNYETSISPELADKKHNYEIAVTAFLIKALSVNHKHFKILKNNYNLSLEVISKNEVTCNLLVSSDEASLNKLSNIYDSNNTYYFLILPSFNKFPNNDALQGQFVSTDNWLRKVPFYKAESFIELSSFLSNLK